MTDFYSWSIDLGRWAGIRVRVHFFLIIFTVFALIGATIGKDQRVVQTLGWLAVLLVVLALHEIGHIIAAHWQDAEPEDILLWELGNLVGPTSARTNDHPVVAAGGLVASGTLALATFVGLWLAGARMVFSPFGGLEDSGAPTLLATHELARPLGPIWYFGWFGWLNWVIFVANLLPALPFDMGRILRAVVGRPGLGYSRDTLVVPWTAHTVAGILAVAGVLRLFFSGRLGDFINLIFLAFLIEIFVRAEARMMEDGSFFDDGVFGYDFSEGYTSLESSAAKVRPYRESALKRWRRRRSDLRRQRRQAQFAAEDRRLDEILDKLHQQGRSALTDEEQRFLVRVSAKIKKRPKWVARLLDAIAARPLLLDAGMGTRLMAVGLDLAADDPALWNLWHPAAVREVHALDIAAGSDSLVTNTFGANSAWLGRYGRSAEVAAINGRAVAIARDAAGPARFLLGSIGPTAADAEGAYRSQAEALAESGVDGILLETHDPSRAAAGLLALRGASGLPIVVSLATRLDDIDDARRLLDLGADVLGVNCVRPSDAWGWVEAVARRPLLHKPSAFHPDGPAIPPARFAAAVPGLLALGVRLFGGCCGATEAHVAALRSALDAAAPAAL